MTVLDRLARKGGVARRKVGRSFVYAPVLHRENLRRLAIRDLVDRFFDGSEDALLEYLTNDDIRGTVAPQTDEEVHLDAALL
jgi:predicted transcriptional regulator